MARYTKLASSAKKSSTATTTTTSPTTSIMKTTSTARATTTTKACAAEEQCASNNNYERLPFRWLNQMTTTIAFAVAAAGLISMLICVSGQIDGYEAGVDYPVYESVPKGLSFNCQGRQPGYYADTETRCQVWHWCLHSGHQYSFLCPNGTVFNQAVRVCDWWSNVNCPGAEQLYENNLELYRTVAPPSDEANL